MQVPAFVSSYEGPINYGADGPPTKAQVELGRNLFYENLLSEDNSMSCATCHLQQNGFSDPKTKSTGVLGVEGRRNAMAIVNLAWDNQFFWDGRRSSLNDQAHDPVVDPLEMNNDWPTVVKRLKKEKKYRELYRAAFGATEMDSTHLLTALAQFERTLISFDSPFDRYFYLNEQNALSADQIAGLDLFFGKAECVHCHSGPLFTDHTFKNNGLDEVLSDLGVAEISHKSSDVGKFKVPTLRNIALTAPYMHDGRFQSLGQVLQHYNEGVHGNSPNLDPDMQVFVMGLQLSPTERQQLKAFLESLTDEKFIQNEKFSKP